MFCNQRLTAIRAAVHIMASTRSAKIMSKIEAGASSVARL